MVGIWMSLSMTRIARGKGAAVLLVGGAVALILSGCTMHVHLGGRYYTQPDRTETATERVDRYLEKAETENAKVASEQPDD